MREGWLERSCEEHGNEGAHWLRSETPRQPRPRPVYPAAEDDESLTADEKAILRFQKQRLKELAGGLS